MKRILLSLLCVICTLPFTSCNKDRYTIHSGTAQGTLYHIIVKNAPRDIEQRIAAVFEKADQTFSIFNPESIISRINRNETRQTNFEFRECYMIAEMVNSISYGYYDITVKPLVDAWGFGPGPRSEHPNVDSLLQFVGMYRTKIENGLLLKQRLGVQLDMSSVAKGYTADMMARMLVDQGIHDFLVEIGGEVICAGKNSRGNNWRVGIDAPIPDTDILNQRKPELQAVLDITGKGIATSGNYRNYFINEAGDRIVHTINPKTGYPMDSKVVSATVISNSCAAADALATLLMAAGGTDEFLQIIQNFSLSDDYYIIYIGDDGELETLMSKGFEKYLVK